MNRGFAFGLVNHYMCHFGLKDAKVRAQADCKYGNIPAGTVGARDTFFGRLPEAEAVDRLNTRMCQLSCLMCFPAAHLLNKSDLSNTEMVDG